MLRYTNVYCLKDDYSIQPLVTAYVGLWNKSGFI